MSTPINTSDNTTERKIPCEVFSRIVGYIRPLQNWHQGKQQEFKDRKTFALPADAVSEE
jgi:anaerobic ribonucleoside-triphosphate reductase